MVVDWGKKKYIWDILKIHVVVRKSIKNGVHQNKGKVTDFDSNLIFSTWCCLILANYQKKRLLEQMYFEFHAFNALNNLLRMRVVECSAKDTYNISGVFKVQGAPCTL